MNSTRRVTIAGDPFAAADADRPWLERGIWPCAWIGHPGAPRPPFVTAFRRCFTLAEAAIVRVHVTADERYELFLDGERIGRGSERGTAQRWYFESYELQLTPGAHVLVARSWALGQQAPYAQASVWPGFLLAPDDATWHGALGTGVAPWEVQLLSGYRFTDPLPAWGTGAKVVIDARGLPADLEAGGGDGWLPAVTLDRAAGATRNEYGTAQLLAPATLPPQHDTLWRSLRVRFVGELPAGDPAATPISLAAHRSDEGAAWQALVDGRAPLIVPPHSARRVLVDLEQYVCAYPTLVVSGGQGSQVRLSWAESLFLAPLPPVKDARVPKGHRAEIDGKYFAGVGDTFLPDGRPHVRFEPLWWQAGRYLELVVRTGVEALTLEQLALAETRYPLEQESQFAADDARLGRILPLTLRTLQLCAHETYMDCPYYEQLQYVGDARLQALTGYAIARDDRLARKALTLFDASRLPSGLTQSRVPSRVTQIIPPFALWWVAMVHDYAHWRDHAAFVRGLLPGVRAVIDGYQRFVNPDGLVEAPGGWNFVDWVPGWDWGIPPDGDNGISSVLNWQWILVLRQVAELEDALGDRELAARARRLAAACAAQITRVFWDDDRGLFADDAAKTRFSEHAQCLALLSGQLEATRQARLGGALFGERDLAPCSIYFSHYLFETCRLLGRDDVLFERLELWHELVDRGLATTIEEPEPCRSDCHAWGAHPLFHVFATILGIRPGGPGFHRVELRPQLGPLRTARGRMVHPRGTIAVALERDAGGLHGQIMLPPGVSGALHYAGRTRALREGIQTVVLATPADRELVT